jgi:acyl-CoA synthetase (AMP-forming)/AMP-acid ligase II
MLALHEIVDQAAQAAPRRPAVVFADEVRTYGELTARTERFAGLLTARGVKRGERIAFWAPNRPEFPEFLFGSSRVGGVAVPLDHWSTADETLAALDLCRPRVLLVADTHAEMLAPHLARLDSAGVSERFVLGKEAPPGWEPYEPAVAMASPVHGATSVNLDDPALILFTSGSTGRSKGAVHSHRGLARTAVIMALELGVRDGERTLHFLPLFSSCLEHLIPLTLARATHVILPKFEPEGAWDAVRRHDITHFDAVPTTLKRMMEHAPLEPPASLRLVSYASEPMPPSLARQWLEHFPRLQLTQFYGMIEQLCLTVLRPSDHPSKVNTVGKSLMGARLRIVSPYGDEVGPGTSGEILAASPTMMQGYFRDPEATGLVIADGWMRTGDLGRFDPDGYLVLEGRLKEVIKSGGMAVVPREVEEVLLEHPDVLEAAVVGLPDERWGEAVHAFVVMRASSRTDPQVLRRFCRDRMTSYKCPQTVHIVTELPRTGIGKIARRELIPSPGDDLVQAAGAQTVID